MKTARSTTHRRSTPLRRLLVIASALTAALLASPAVAGAATPGPYNALGDSYSSGVGTGSATGSCGRSPKAYPPLYTNANHPASFAFLACSGATIADVAGQVSSPTFSTTASLVTLTAGGNDVGFTTVLTNCTIGSDAACNAAVQKGIDVVNSAKFHNDYLALLKKIHDTAPNSNVVVLGYPKLFETTAVCFAIAPSQSRRISINRGADALIAAIKSAVAADQANAGRHVRFVDVDPRFTGHRVCSTSPWINGTTFPISESYHPNSKGHANAYLPALTGALSASRTAGAA